MNKHISTQHNRVRNTYLHNIRLIRRTSIAVIRTNPAERKKKRYELSSTLHNLEKDAAEQCITYLIADSDGVATRGCSGSRKLNEEYSVSRSRYRRQFSWRRRRNQEMEAISTSSIRSGEKTVDKTVDENVHQASGGHQSNRCQINT